MKLPVKHKYGRLFYILTDFQHFFCLLAVFLLNSVGILEISLSVFELRNRINNKNFLFLENLLW